jgi:uncharacterized SAM-binding protein YcdF (DUF218 family)
MFVLSKIFWIVLNPGNLFAFALLAGTILLFTRYRRTGRILVSGAAVFLLIVAVFPIGASLIERLENRFPGNPDIPRDIAGIIVLGGTINQYLTVTRGQPSMTTGGERLTETVYLGRKFPWARIIFSGGSGALIDQDLKEADAARMFFDRMGMPSNRVEYESASRNTLENARFSLKIAGDSGKNQRWVLVTSAAHMPRAMGVFRKAGWNVIAFPVDYWTDGYLELRLGFYPVAGLTQLNLAMREWMGLIAYRILGRTSAILPSPGTRTDN